ncbi:MAG: protein-export membrane protein SecD [Candidatus Portnoybacteria bacterium RBG_19FT_COMBO_36_7]|uniref:Protein translocase subunit SecD n=1 Tax=Candidatus Portnoybacteria bacterium RBG_19FT_COMBO_36_7 TaxID=1801992 RepID=A0A1G2F8C8_9BACT|nr:MAG: protein-export membrane protein SecD [Candidatus Portnoybacteria bacterium RBG_19FT_COMBO_36_7]
MFWIVLAIILLIFFAAFLDYPRAWNKSADWLNAKKNEVGFLQSLPNLPQFFNVQFRLGLDLQGGTHLIYEADLAQVASENINDAMQGVRDVIERRVNAFGIAEPLVQVEAVGDHHRLIVELAGISDVNQAIQMIGETPFLEFKEETMTAERDQILASGLDQATIDQIKDVICLNPEMLITFLRGYPGLGDPCYKSTGLNGRYLSGAQVNYDQTTYRPLVALQFNDDGAKIFEDITRRNVSKKVAIYLDGEPISIPTVQDVITGGKAQITGTFTDQEVKTLAQRLNAGALPVPIELISQQTVGPSLGQKSLDQSLKAGFFGFLAIVLFLIIFYRIPGFFASFSLIGYIVLLLAIFKVFHITLTLAGIAGFILSMGMAVDANVLIFSRIREELKQGRTYLSSLNEGFKRAWPSIRDGNFTTILVGLILLFLGTSFVKGFGLILVIGNLVGMFSAIFITYYLLKIFSKDKSPRWARFWQ